MRAREQLIDAARVVFERDAFHGARIVDVANTAGVGIGTFYRHFESKSALFQAVIGHVFDEIYVGGATSSADPADPAAAIELANRRFVEQYRREAPVHSVLEQLAPIDEGARQVYLAGRSRAVERIAHSIASLQGRGLANPDLDSRVAAGALVAMVNNSAHIWFNLGEPFDEDVALATLNQLWINGIGLDDSARHEARASPKKPRAPTNRARSAARDGDRR